MHTRRSAVAALAALALVAGCSSSGPGSPVHPSSSPAGTGAPVLSAALPRTPGALATAMRHGLAVATTARVTISKVPHHARVSGTILLAGGTPTAFDVTSGTGGSAVRLVVVNSVAYARFGTATTWSPVPATGRLTAGLRRARAQLAMIRRLADPAAVLAAVGSARVQLLGRGAVGQVPAAHYLLRTGTSLRTQLWVDGGSRPLMVERTGWGTVEFSGYGAAVHITAPAPSEFSR